MVSMLYACQYKYKNFYRNGYNQSICAVVSSTLAHCGGVHTFCGEDVRDNFEECGVCVLVGKY